MRRRKLPPPGGPTARRRRKVELEEHEPSPVDLISTLPDELLGEIISLLPIKDAARTQILASRWRRLWHSTPLSLDCCQLSGVNSSYLCPSLVLSAHPGPGRRFCLKTDNSIATPTVDQWLRSAALDNLQELEFAGRGFTCPVPASIFRFAHTLRVANIRHCILPDAAVQGLHFPQLKQLGLEYVRVSEPSLHRLIAGCPALEFLLILCSFGFHSLRINSLSLRRICVRTEALDAASGSTQLQFGELIIENAPRLESLIHLYTLWLLGEIAVYTKPKVDALDFLTDLQGFRQGLVVNSPTTVVRNVRSLAISMDQLIVDNVVRLMRLFPSLKELYVKSGESTGKNWWRRKHRNFIRCHDIRLKIVVLETYLGTLPHVNFATFFVLNAKLLEKMTFHTEASVCSDKFLAQQYRRLQLDKRVSRGARFRFTSASCQHIVSSTKHLREFDMNYDPFTCRC